MKFTTKFINKSILAYIYYDLHTSNDIEYILDLFSTFDVFCSARFEFVQAAAAVAVGVATDELDRIVHEATVERESYPSPLNYYCFPKSCCT